VGEGRAGGPGGPRRETISFLSDYGTRDEFVGVVHSVLRQLAPHVAVIDVCHEVAPHDVRAGSLTLARSMQYLAPGVVLAVVDPGVGGPRRGVAVELASDGPGPASVLVGPDNGLLAPAVAMAGGALRAVSLTNVEHHLAAPGPTFAGRDVFAPAAARLCTGTALDDLGEAIDPGSLLPGIVPLPRVEGDRLVGEVLWVDRFGNVQLNLDPDDVARLGPQVTVTVGERHRVANRVSAFSELRPGQVGLLVDSYGMLALVLDRRPAAEELHVAAGDALVLSAAAE